MVYVLVKVLETVVTDTSKKEPRPNILVLFLGQGLQTLGSSVDIDRREMAWELSLVLSDEAPIAVLLALTAFDVQASDLIATEFEPKHVICHIEVQMILLGVALEQFALRHQISLRVLHWLLLGRLLHRQVRALSLKLGATRFLRQGQLLILEVTHRVDFVYLT